MANSEWGKKHSCTSCNALFYDMKKDPAHCPACGAKVDQQPLLRPRRTPAAKRITKPAEVSKELNNVDLPNEIEDVELNDEDVDISPDDDEDLIVDVDEDLGDNDLPEVSEHIDSTKD